MNNCMITFRSVTPAQRGEAVLRRVGIACTLHRTPRRMEQQGCGYSVHLHLSQVPRAVAVLREERVSFRKVYLLKENGSMEELRL